MQSSLAMPRGMKLLGRTMTVQIMTFSLFIIVSEHIFALPLVASTLFGFIIARLLSLSLSWQFLNGILPLVIVWGSAHSLPSWLFILIAITLFALFIPAFFSQVPFFPSSPAVVKKLITELPKQKPFRFIDLGCGFGEPLFSLARAHPNGIFVGIDVSPFSLLIAWLRSFFFSNVTIRAANLWSYSLTDYQIIYAFLAPPPMRQLGEKLQAELPTGSLIISNTFPIPGWQAREIATGDARQHTLYIYCI